MTENGSLRVGPATLERADRPRPVAASRVPLWLKVAYTAFVAVLVPVYWYWYGPTNFLYFCDVAVLLTVPALWLESAFLASMGAAGILVPQLVWQVDFLSGGNAVGLTKYMFDENKKLYLRGLSLFHFWLPILLVWMVWRLGYDRRGTVAWCLLGWALLAVCYFWLPAPPPPADNKLQPVNINNVYGFDDDKAQTLMHPLLWLAAMFVCLPLTNLLPAHLVLSRLARPVEAAP